MFSSTPSNHPGTNNLRPILVCVFISMGAFVFGYDTGCISGALVMPDFTGRFGELQDDGSYALGSSRESLVVSFLSIGTFLGAFLQSYSTDMIGRKWSIFLWSAIFTIGAVIQTASFYSIWQLIAGLGVGALSALVTLFSGEVAPARMRGPMLALYTVMNVVGLFLSYMVSLGSEHLEGSASWRIPVGLQIPLGVLLMIGICFVPDSPRRLLFLGKEDEARKALAFINGLPAESGQVDELMDEVRVGMAKENEGGKSGWLDCFGKEFSRQNFYYYYGATFFQSTGTGLNAFEIQAIMGGVAICTVGFGLYVVDHWGRRKGLIIGTLAEAVCAIVAGLVGHFMLASKGTPDSEITQTNKTGGAVVIAFAFAHLAAYNGIAGGLPWTYLGESFPTRIRAKAVAIGTMSNWFWNFLISFFSPRIIDSIGPLILLIFAGMLVLSALYTYFLLRETRGLTLEQVDEMYRAHVTPWRSSRWQPTTGPARKGLQLAPAFTQDSDRTLFPVATESKEKVTEVFGSHAIKKDKSNGSGERRSLDSVDVESV
ncbi:hypothetical protein JCM8097_002960 [Rhodosporidiobolus ruineniae]